MQMSKTAKAVLDVMRSWLGYSEANGKYRRIIDLYNSVKPLPVGYAVKYTDEWCDACLSAAAIKAGCSDLIGRECGVGRHIEIFKKKGIWIEDGKRVPKPGWVIVYNWNDSSQPNNGGASHIGYVEKVSGGRITAIEGNKHGMVARRVIPVGWGYIRGYAAPRYKSSTKSSAGKKESTATKVVREVIAGKWGNGKTRQKRLRKAGYDPTAIQKEVNRLMK